jgi:hypothetical protein
VIRAAAPHPSQHEAKLVANEQPVFDQLRRARLRLAPFTRIEVETEAHLVQLPRYIALNPREYETWPYSSYPGMIGLREPFSFVDPTPIIETFGSVAAFRAYVDEGRAAEDANLVPASPATRFE